MWSGLEDLRGWRLYDLCGQTILVPSAVHWKTILCPIRPYFNLCPLFLCVIHHCEEPRLVLWAPAGCYFFPCLFSRLNQAHHSLPPLTKDKRASPSQPGGLCWTPWTSSPLMVGLPVLCSSWMRLFGSSHLTAPYQLFMFTLIGLHSCNIKQNSLCQKPMADQNLTQCPRGTMRPGHCIAFSRGLNAKGKSYSQLQKLLQSLESKSLPRNLHKHFIPEAMSCNWETLSKEQC